ncbi:enoyl-CoA hydratase/carnithine racemase [Saccharomonospora marina XMU15]|uniref:enoyl-CoA hydratase n=1 Tax=Saccharomonospora marina XMU15 TaxID=882083 RepID=H5X6Q0_9PSEU|nr:acetyl-CoA acetyltransferase [Saccharomonospora marina]EHR51271.1 enoyl-CoA hydratase/carnithine racemase [Saccharomonospora marina XMU15]
MTGTELDPSTPVVVGVGQFSERIGEPGYQALSAVDLAARAVRSALRDAGADEGALAGAVDTVAGIRQFENSSPVASAPLGRSDNYPRSVANRVGASPARAVLEVSGGQGPQHLVTELAATIAAGDSEVALAFGSEAISTVQHLASADDKPDFTEHVEASLEDRGFGLQGLITREQLDHGLADVPAQYALFENARRARLKLSREDYATAMGELFAPFTKVAATNPHAAAPIERDARELATPSESNRPVVDPYPRYLVAREKVNQAAAVLVMSVRAAERLGVPRANWVFLHGHADTRERPLFERDDLSRAPAAVLAVEHALRTAGITVADLHCIDLYSCFPIAVFAVCDGLGLATDDPRGLTVTGGLPFFGGPGNNYSMHAIAETVSRLRQRPGGYGLVGANGGMLSKYSVGVYSTTPVNWRADTGAEIQAEIDSWPAPGHAQQADGWATIETYTVKYGRDGKRSAVVIGRLESDGRRFVATDHGGDEELLDRLCTGEPIGTRVYARSFGFGNRVTTTAERMAELFPPRPKALRQRYEFVEVRRDGHVLEITINRPESRNSLHPPANQELDEIFDAYFADDGLWVAILTGAGDKAFSAGNDLMYSASGKQLWVPKNGFAGLTSRRQLHKPVIAAVNGFAMGGGLEIALACHLVVADETAQFALSEVRVGLIAGAGGLIRLPRTVPPKVANEMILTGKRISAQQAQQWGLVNRVVEQGAALRAARELAGEILAGSPTSVRASLQVMEQTQGIPDVVDAVTHPTGALDDLLVSEDTIEGITAFAQKRPPVWRNR